MAYKIEFAPRAERQFRKLKPEIQQRLVPVIDALAMNPRPHGVKKLSGEEDIYRIRAGDYRILYRIQDRKLIVLILNLGDRKAIYRKLK